MRDALQSLRDVIFDLQNLRVGKKVMGCTHRIFPDRQQFGQQAERAGGDFVNLHGGSLMQ